MKLISLIYFLIQVRVGSWSHLTDVSGTLQYIYSVSYTQVRRYETIFILMF